MGNQYVIKNAISAWVKSGLLACVCNAYLMYKY
jgi:hypothetical protein